MDIFLYVLLAIVVLVFLYAMFTYNRFVVLRTRSTEAWADIDVQLKRRYDLIPNLVETVRGYMTHERETLESVTNARTQALGASSVKEQEQADNLLTGTLKTLFAVAENYPDLKANTNFLELQRELADTENKIQAARRFYNTNVRDLNIKVEQFPSNIIAGWFNFDKKDYFELEADSVERENVSVRF